jgi:hypothetical protein
MSQENMEAAQPSTRGLVDRILVRAPALAAVIGAGVMRAPVGSQMRRLLVGVTVSRGFAAMARSDVDVVVVSYEPDAEVWMRDMSGVGVNDCYRGHQGIRALYADLDEVFNDWSWSIKRMVDGGDRLVIMGNFVGYGRGSGAKTALTDGATAVRLSSRGLVACRNGSLRMAADEPSTPWGCRSSRSRPRAPTAQC